MKANAIACGLLRGCVKVYLNYYVVVSVLPIMGTSHGMLCVLVSCYTLTDNLCSLLSLADGTPTVTVYE